MPKSRRRIFMYLIWGLLVCAVTSAMPSPRRLDQLVSRDSLHRHPVKRQEVRIIMDGVEDLFGKDGAEDLAGKDVADDTAANLAKNDGKNLITKKLDQKLAAQTEIRVVHINQEARSASTAASDVERARAASAEARAAPAANKAAAPAKESFLKKHGTTLAMNGVFMVPMFMPSSVTEKIGTDVMDGAEHLMGHTGGDAAATGADAASGDAATGGSNAAAAG